MDKAHDLTWASKFDAEAKRPAQALGSAACAIHHIGSTVIPDLVAKSVIDVLVEAASASAIDARTGSLKVFGYEARGENGTPGRRYFSKDDCAGVQAYHVHAFAIGSDEVIPHLAFRDYLRAHSKTAQAYSKLKRELAQQAGKAPFVDAMLPQAVACWRLLNEESDQPGHPSARRHIRAAGPSDRG